MKHFTTSVAEHVAARETERFVSSVAEQRELTQPMVDAIQAVDRVFAKGRRLSDADFYGVAERLESSVLSVEPYVFEKAFRPASRVRPNGEALEILSVSQVRRQDDPCLRLMTNRIFLTRKRFEYETGAFGVHLAKHLLSRAVERNVVSGDGLAGLAQAAVDSRGLGIVWHMASSSKLVPYESFFQPYAGGLLIGAMCVSNPALIRTTVARDGRRTAEVGNGDFASVMAKDGGTLMRRHELATIISEDMMSESQASLHAALSDFAAEHSEMLERIGRAASFPHAELQPNPGFEEMRPSIDSLVRRLADVLLASEHQQALRSAHEHHARRMQELGGEVIPLADAA